MQRGVFVIEFLSSLFYTDVGLVELWELFLEIIKRNIPVQPQRIGTITP